MADYIGSFSGSFTGSYDILTNTEEYDGTTYGYVLHQRAGIGKAENILLSDFFRDWLGSESGSAGIQDYGAAGYINDSDRILIRSQSFDGSTTRPILKTATLSNLFGGYSTNASLRNTFVYARGVGRNTEPITSNSSSMVLTMGGAVVYDNNVGGGELHGLTLTILEATDFSTVSTTRYNTAHGGTTSAANSLATAIDDMSPTEVGVITSLGHWETYVTSTLRTAAKKVGLSKLGGYVSSDSGSAYASVFYGTSGSAGVGDVIERLVAYRFTTGSDLDIPTATITTRLQSNVHGVYPFVNISDASSTNALYRFSADTSSVLEPALLVNSDGNINAAGDVITFKSDTATITMDMSSDSARLFVDGYVSTSGHIVPSTTQSYDLGSTDLRWRDLYLSGSTSTIYLGTSQLSSDGTNTSGSFTGSFSGEGTNIVGIVSSSYADSSSYANSSSYADSSSYAVTASYAINGGSGGGGGTPGGSTTQIQYNNAGAFGGASGFVWDSINGRVGLGTGSPSEKLDVVGNTSIGGRLKLDYGGTVMTRMTNTGNTDLSWDTRIADTSGVYEIRSVQDNGTSVKTPLSIAHATGYATFNERVGIGTASPTASLHVVGVGYFQADGAQFGSADLVSDAAIVIPEDDFIYTADGTPGSAYLRRLIGKQNDAIIIGTSATSLIDEIRFQPGTTWDGTRGFTSFYNNTTEVARFTGDGLGIGTTSPGELLHLSASGDANIRLENNGNGNTSAIEFWRQRSAGTGARGASIWIESDTGTNNTELYIDTSTSAGAPGSTTLGTNNGRIVVRGASSPSVSLYAGTAGPEVRLTTTGLGIGTTTPAEKLTVDSGNILVRDTANQPAIGTEKTNSVPHLHAISPGGAFYSTTTNSVVGAIEITLPSIIASTDGMLTAWIDIYDYAGGTLGESISVFVAGYAYSVSPTYWFNCAASVITNRTDKNFTVRFAEDGTNHKIYIGEIDSTWNYPQVQIRDVQVGFSDGTAANFLEGWTVAFESVAFDNIEQVVTPHLTATKLLGTGADGDNEIVYMNGTTGEIQGSSAFTFTGAGGSGTGNLSVSADTDSYADIGRTRIGYSAYSDHANFSHVDMTATGQYAVLQAANGITYLNAASGQSIRFRINNSAEGLWNSTGLRIGDETAPSYTLDVSGSFRTTGNAILGDGTGDAHTVSGSLSGVGWSVTNAGSSTFAGITMGGVLITESGDRSGIIEFNRSAEADAYAGVGIKFSTTSEFQMMASENLFGHYDDQNNDWMTQYDENGAFRLYYNGANKLATTSAGITVTGTGTATDFLATSDIRLKNVIDVSVPGLETVMSMLPIRHTWKDQRDTKEHLGFSAQDMKKLVPEVVESFTKNESVGSGLNARSVPGEDYLTISYGKLVPVLVKAIQELTEEVRELKKRVEE